MSNMKLLLKTFVQQIEYRDRQRKAGKNIDADPEHSILERAKTFQHLLEHYSAMGVPVPIDTNMLQKWGAADAADMKDIPPGEGLEAFNAMSVTAKSEPIYRICVEKCNPLAAAVFDESFHPEPDIVLNTNSFSGVESSAYKKAKPRSIHDEADHDPVLTANRADAYGRENAKGAIDSQAAANDGFFSLVDGVVTASRKKGLETYSVDGVKAFNVLKNSVDLVKGQEPNEKAVLAALLFASHRYGGSITINGTPAFQAFAMEIMAKNKLDIKLSNPEQADQYLKVASAMVQTVSPEKVSAVEDVAHRTPFYERMANIGSVAVSAATGGVISAEKIREVADSMEEHIADVIDVAKKNGPTLH